MQQIRQINQILRPIQELLLHVNGFFWNIFRIHSGVKASPAVTLIIVLILLFALYQVNRDFRNFVNR